MPDETPPAGPAPAAAAGHDDLPEWLTKIPGVDVPAVKANKELVEQIRGGWLREKDYTQKSQEVASLRKVKEKLGDRDIEAELNRLAQWDQWQQSEYPKLEAQAARVADLERIAREADKGPKAESQPRTGYKISTDDLFEQTRLDEAVRGLETGIEERAYTRTKKWYQDEELPRLDKVAAGMLQLPMGLIRTLWPKELTERGVTVDRVLKEAVASQNFDYPKVVAGLMAGQETVKKEGYDEGYQKGLAESKAAGNGSASPAPPGYGSPTWRRPPDAMKKGDKGQLFESVMKDVQAKHGALPY